MIESAIPEMSVDNFTARRQYDAHDYRSAAPESRPRTSPAISHAQIPAKADFARDYTRRWLNIIPQIFAVAVALALWIGWLNRDDNGLTPGSGVGYWLGIAGSGLMLLSLLYPLRKRVRSLRVIGTIAFWLRVHMTLGVLGPVLILWHANFGLGSINCSVALVTMLVVAVSGVVGRFLHRKIHFALYERKTEAQEILADADELRGFLGADPYVAGRMIAELNAFARLGTEARKSVLAVLVLQAMVGWRGAVLRRRLTAHARQVIAVEGRRRRRSQEVQRQQLAGVRDFVTQYIGAAQKAATFAFYERLFRLWHVFHVPLFILLLIVAIIHVVASHFY
jgi:hypothetical protein